MQLRVVRRELAVIDTAGSAPSNPVIAVSHCGRQAECRETLRTMAPVCSAAGWTGNLKSMSAIDSRDIPLRKVFRMSFKRRLE